MRLGRFKQTTTEVKRYTFDYSDWLDAAETLGSCSFSITPISTTPLQVRAYSLTSDALSVIFYIGGGVADVEYTIEIAATTSAGQVKEDSMALKVTP